MPSSFTSPPCSARAVGLAMALTLAVLDLSPLRAADKPEALLAKAQSHLARLDYAAAEPLLVEALDSRSRATNPAAFRMTCLKLLAETNRRLGRRDESLKHAQDYRKGLPRRSEALIDSTLEIAEDYAALGKLSEARFEFDALFGGRYGTLKPLQRLRALVNQAIVEDQLGLAGAEEGWRQAEGLATDVLRSHRGTLSPVDEIECLIARALAREARTGKSEADRDELKRRALRKDDKALLARGALGRIGLQCLQRSRPEAAEVYLRDALAAGPADPGARAQWQLALARSLKEQKKEAEAAAAFETVARSYEKALLEARQAKDHPHEWGLLRQLRWLYQQLENWPKAISAGEELCERLEADVGEKSPLTRQAQGELGSLYALTGSYEKAVAALQKAIGDDPEKTTVATPEQASWLNNLGAAERARGNLVAAEKAFEQALAVRTALYGKGPSHPDLAASYNNLASVYVARGNYRQAIKAYEYGRELCEQLQPRPEGLLSTMLLNLAGAYRSQGQYHKALEACERSLEIHENAFGKESLGIVAHYNALSALARAQGDWPLARRLSEQALKLCEKHGQADSPLAAAAYFSLGVGARVTGDRAAARQSLEKALQIQQSGGQRLLAARTQNVLGILQYQDHDLDAARKTFEAALATQSQVAGMPQERFSVLCNLAAVVHDQGDLKRALELLKDAEPFSEVVRAESLTAEFDRARLFQKFASAFERQVEWNLELGQIEAAFQAAERSRSRTFLDQLQMAGVDVRRLLQESGSPEALSLLDREATLRGQLASLRAQWTVASAESRPTLAAAVSQQQSELAKVWSEIRSRSLLSRTTLVDDKSLVTLPALQKSVLGPRDVMVTYAIGQQRSYVLVFSGGNDKPDSFELQIDTRQIEQIKTALLASGLASPESTASRTRALVAVEASEKGEAIVADIPDGYAQAGPFTRSACQAAVTWYRDLIRRKQAGITRGLVGIVAAPKGTPEKMATEVRGDAGAARALSTILLPDGLLKAVARRKPERVILLPDGPLHELPFECLAVGDPTAMKYLLEEWPPICYAPSASIYAALTARAHATTATPTLLSVGDAEYGSLPALPGTREECQQVQSVWKDHQWPCDVLLGADATESKIRSQLASHAILHFATHGVVDRSFENLFGGIAVTVPRQSETVTAEDDGLLSYAEILELPLKHCDLAVLSACETNVGTDRPLEAATTLTQAFLAAGARSVIASQWQVADKSTSQLMTEFFRDASQQSQAHDYARALQQSKRKLAKSKEYSEPYYWAPFVLIGPGR